MCCKTPSQVYLFTPVCSVPQSKVRIWFQDLVDLKVWCTYIDQCVW